MEGIEVLFWIGAVLVALIVLGIAFFAMGALLLRRAVAQAESLKQSRA